MTLFKFKLFSKKSKKVVSFKGRLNFENMKKGDLKKLDQILSSKKSIEINLKNVEFLYPSSLVIILAAYEHLKNRGIALSIAIEKDSQVHHYLNYVNIEENISIPNVVERTAPPFNKEDVIPLKYGDTIRNEEKLARNIVELLEKHQAQDDKSSIDNSIIDGVSEILLNVKQHSDFKKYILLAQSYPTSKKSRFVIYDNGIGIREHMTQGDYEKKHSAFKNHISKSDYERMRVDDIFAILKAVEECVSATSYRDNSGAGLNFLLEEISKPRKGVVSIISGNGFVQWKRDEVSSYKLKAPLQGTLISMTLTGEGGSESQS